jgi:hypothetical protein
MYDDLINAPPRLSDLHGDELRIALRNRHDANKARWLESRRPRPLLARLFGRVA